MPIIAGFFVPHPPIILPEVGQGEERKIQKTIDSYKDIANQIDELNPDTIILSSPHAPAYRDYFHVASGEVLQGDFGRFGAAKVHFKITLDVELTEHLHQRAIANNLPIGTAGSTTSTLDHGSMVPLYFLSQYLHKYRFLIVSPTALSIEEHYQMGRFITSELPSNKRVIWLASGDLSHTLKADGPYGLTKEGPIFDRRFTDMLESGSLSDLFDLDPVLCEKAAVCGLGSFAMMAGAMANQNPHIKLLSYEAPFGVGYAIASLYPGEEVHLKEDPYVQLAKQSLTYYLKHHRALPVPSDLPSELLETRQGAFVSIHKHDRLRGCIGTIHPTQPTLAEEIIQNAISSGIHDYRFQPIKQSELPDLEFSVDVLFPPESISSPQQLDVKRYGVIVRHQYKSGLLLPNLDGIDTIEQQIEIARKKAGIHESEPYTLERFEVIRHH